MNKLAASALAGFAATAPMSVVMEILHRLPWSEPRPLPPHQISMRLAEQAGLKQHMDEKQRRELTLASHFGYGAAAGVLYGLLSSKLPGPPALKGALFGLSVWAASYQGLLPALEILSPATQHSARRNALMILSHLVWGAFLGLLTQRWADAEEAPST